MECFVFLLSTQYGLTCSLTSAPAPFSEAQHTVSVQRANRQQVECTDADICRRKKRRIVAGTDLRHPDPSPCRPQKIGTWPRGRKQELLPRAEFCFSDCKRDPKPCPAQPRPMPAQPPINQNVPPLMQKRRQQPQPGKPGMVRLQNQIQARQSGRRGACRAPHPLAYASEKLFCGS